MADTSSSAFVEIDVEQTLRFFDEKPGWSIGHATGVVGVVGEDLNAACFQHYVESVGGSAIVRDDSVTTGGTKGPRLDRWIVVDWPGEPSTVYQTEIKNWSAHAIGGEILRFGASTEEVAGHKQRRWEGRWDSQRQTLKHPNMGKVLVPMDPPRDLKGENIQPLLIFWEPIGPMGTDSHLFKEASPTCDFPFALPSTWPSPRRFPLFRNLWVFSVSSYLRSISDAHVKLQMPHAAERLRMLGRLFRLET